MVCIDIIENIKSLFFNVNKFFFIYIGIVKTWMAHDRYLPNSLRILLKRFLDITTPPTPNLLRYFASIATNPNEQAQLNLLASVNTTLIFNFKKFYYQKYKKQKKFYIGFSSIRGLETLEIP